MLSDVAFGPVDEQAEERESVIARAKVGDHGAFELLVRRHERQVLSTALRLLGNREDAKDAAQSVFLRLFRYLRCFEEGRELAPWLYRMTVNVCHDIQKKKRYSSFVSLDDVEEPSSAEREPGAQLDDARIMEAALGKLTSTERAAIVLRDLQGLTTREVAGALGSSETTIRSHISRARVKLKAYRDRALGRTPA